MKFSMINFHHELKNLMVQMETLGVEAKVLDSMLLREDSEAKTLNYLTPLINKRTKS